MSNATPSRFGQVNGSGDVDALFLKVFSGEVMAEFETANVSMDKHFVRQITSGKAADFPKLGKTTAAYHTPGVEITGGQINSGQETITINDLLLSSVFIANIDEAKTHFDVRGHYAREMGLALANQMDRHVLQTGIQAALRSTPTLTGGNAGEIIDNASLGSGKDMDANANDLVDAIMKGRETMDENGVPEEDVFIYLRPKHYYLLANSSKVQNVEFGNTGNGSVSDGKVLRVAGVPVVKTTQLPTTNVTTGVSAGSAGRQAVDARNTVALLMHKSAVGTVKLLDLATEGAYDIRRQGTLMVAKYAVGHGVLRPEGAVLLRTATPT